jgi:hypothetical protein
MGVRSVAEADHQPGDWSATLCSPGHATPDSADHGGIGGSVDAMNARQAVQASQILDGG